ncbi:hypothetical protein PCANC_08903 [Puccinia coronata f. sp. avenae]|nr:hypothetical protein PCASD_19335 [Puccinia coronata f. sp. avenae]PLW35876.1 hypothetical protein PCASD_12132 [Puccinia coronata f. sp. avenae]PLW42093.1 hypothetical protein PCASD_11956 [Puccinia coronata f. sp. avenae]PLW52837.1 hypothetical protein PCANC_08903 [Puccinia coronata f. sp. avenae]
MAPQADQIQRQRLKKEADTQDQAADDNSITPDSPSPSHQPAVDDQDESPVDSPVASTAMSRVSSGVGVNKCIQAESSAQSPNSHAKGKAKANSLSYQERVQTTSYPGNGFGLSGLQESSTLMSGT